MIVNVKLLPEIKHTAISIHSDINHYKNISRAGCKSKAARRKKNASSFKCVCGVFAGGFYCRKMLCRARARRRVYDVRPTYFTHYHRTCTAAAAAESAHSMILLFFISTLRSRSVVLSCSARRFFPYTRAAAAAAADSHVCARGPKVMSVCCWTKRQFALGGTLGVCVICECTTHRRRRRIRTCALGHLGSGACWRESPPPVCMYVCVYILHTHQYVENTRASFFHQRWRCVGVGECM